MFRNILVNLILQSQSSRRSIAHWSKLGLAFNSKPKNSFLKNIGRPSQGLFGIPQLTDHTGFYELKDEVISRTDELVKEICSAERRRILTQVFDELSDALCRVADMAEFIRNAHTNKNFRQGAEDAFAAVSSLVEMLNTNQDIYKALKHVCANGDIFEMDATDKRVAELFLFDFEKSGVHLSNIEREQFVKLTENIHLLSAMFMEHCHQPSLIKRSQIESHLQNVFSWNGDQIAVNGLYSENSSPLVREAAYKIFLQHDQLQAKQLDSLLLARHEMATLTGFQTFAHRELQGTLMNSPENVKNFLEMIFTSFYERTVDDFDILQRIKSDLGFAGTIEPWDVPYFTSAAKNQISQSKFLELTNYLPLGACMEGLNNLFSSLFDVTLECVEVGNGEVWAKDIYKLEVVHKTEGVLGYIYCDFFERSGKPYQDCHFTIRGGKEMVNHYQKPVVVLMLNLPSPSSSMPSLLNPSSLENLFHEFGHALHSMLGRTRYQHVTGTRCPTDFAEVPSILMEYFALDPKVLKSFARHWQTGECVPDSLAEKCFEYKRMFSAMDTSHQVLHSEVDQALHSSLSVGKSTKELVSSIQEKYSFFKIVPNTSWHLRFGHLVPYGAKYYSYLTSRAIASKIWNSYFQKDPFSKHGGTKYREELLKYGGEKSPETLVTNMLNEKPTNKLMVESLVNEFHALS